MPEYLFCSKPLLTIDCKRMAALLGEKKSVFLVENQIDIHRELFRNFHIKDKLSQLEDTICQDMESFVLKDKKFC